MSYYFIISHDSCFFHIKDREAVLVFVLHALVFSDFYASFMTVDNHVKRLQTRTTLKEMKTPASCGRFVIGADDGSRTHQKHRLYALSDGVVLHFVLHASKKNLSLFRIASFFASLRVC